MLKKKYVLESLSGTIVNIQTEKDVQILNLLRFLERLIFQLIFRDKINHQERFRTFLTLTGFPWHSPISLFRVIRGHQPPTKTIPALCLNSGCFPQSCLHCLCPFKPFCLLHSSSSSFTENFSCYIQYSVLDSLTLYMYYLKLSATILCVFYFRQVYLSQTFILFFTRMHIKKY